MKRYQPYFAAESSSPLEHHFRVGCRWDDFNTIYFGWNGKTLTEHASWFGWPERCPPSSENIFQGLPETTREELSKVIPLLQKAYLENTPESTTSIEDIGICYDGYFAKYRICKYIPMNRKFATQQQWEEFLEDFPNATPKEIKKWGWRDHWDNLMSCPATIRINEDGTHQVIECVTGDGPSSTHIFEAPKLVYDYFTVLEPENCIPGENIPKGYGKKVGLVDIDKMMLINDQLIPILQESKILTLEEFNKKYHLETDLGLENFRQEPF